MRNYRTEKGQLIWLGLSFFVIAVDQITKWLAVNHLSLGTPFVINRFFNLTLGFNRGAAFSVLGSANGWQMWFFSAIALTVSFFIVRHLWHMPKADKFGAVSLALILGGAMGNLIDRVRYGHVIDFISWHVQMHYWPTFNMADAAICVGAGLFFLSRRHD